MGSIRPSAIEGAWRFASQPAVPDSGAGGGEGADELPFVAQWRGGHAGAQAGTQILETWPIPSQFQRQLDEAVGIGGDQVQMP